MLIMMHFIDSLIFETLENIRIWRELCNAAANDGESEKVSNQKCDGNQYFHISPGVPLIIWSKDSGILEGVKYELKHIFSSSNSWWKLVQFQED